MAAVVYLRKITLFDVDIGWLSTKMSFQYHYEWYMTDKSPFLYCSYKLNTGLVRWVLLISVKPFRWIHYPRPDLEFHFSFYLSEAPFGNFSSKMLFQCKYMKKHWNFRPEAYTSDYCYILY